MKRIALAVSMLAALAALAWPIADGLRREPEVCARMTPAKILEHPGLADEYARALLSGESGEVARVEAMLRGIREAHGCGGEVTLPHHPITSPGLPPGHPPVPAAPFPSLPPGPAPFEAPSTYAI